MYSHFLCKSLLLSVLAFVLSGVFMPASVYAARSYFDMSEVFSDNVAPFHKWTGMKKRLATQRLLSDEQCHKVRFHPCIAETIRSKVEAMTNRTLGEKLIRVNSLANNYPYIQDSTNWGSEDYWETPYEFLTISGDCEDYAITKYYTLRKLNVPADKMRIIILQDLNLGGIIHAVLGVYNHGKLMLLDNQIKEVIDSASVYHYKPIYGINEDGWWAYYPK